MQEHKLQKRKKKAIEESNDQVLASTCSDLGDLYNRLGRYETALQEYKIQAKTLDKLGKRMESAKAHRMIGEMYMLLAEFAKALKHEEIHLAIARELNCKLEEQRAMATIGRTHLLHGQSIPDQKESQGPLKLAEKAFMRSIVLCESLKGKVSNQELMDMRARLLLNLGVVLEHLGNYERALEFMEKAITICRTQNLHDLLHQCYMSEGLMLYHRHNDYEGAIGIFNRALEVAGRLPDKIAYLCETLWWKAKVLIKKDDLQSAKQILIKAWKLKSPNQDEHENIEKYLKIVAAMCYTEDSLITVNSTDYAKRKMLYEKMGDGSCLLKNYSKAIMYYKNMLEQAELNGENGKKLVPIYVSLYQTYKDNREYDLALEYSWKEYKLCSDNPKEAFNTLINIAELMELAGKEYWEMDSVYRKCRIEAQKSGSLPSELLCLQKYIKLQRTNNMNASADILEKEMSCLGPEGDSDSGTDSEIDSLTQNTPNIGDDICIEDLSDISDIETCEDVDHPQTARKRGHTLTIKKNNKGETQLHQACISGNTSLVRRLLDQNHPVNVRDHAGWLPLHEACINGHKDIVEMLLNEGAAINDRGGDKCDGITPLYDAASNGHLDIIELLLDHGASAIVLTDDGDSALQILKKWHKSATLNASEQVFYDTVYARLCTDLVSAGIEDATGSQKENIAQNERTSNKRSRLKEVQDLQQNISESNRKVNSDMSMNVSRQNTSVIGRLRSTIDDCRDIENPGKFQELSSDSELCDFVETESDDSIMSETQIETNARNEYQNVMKSLRRMQDSVIVDCRASDNCKKRPALMNPDEVGDDWLENDVQNETIKRRKTMNDPLATKSNLSLVPSTYSTNIDIDNGFKSKICEQSNVLDICDSDSVDSIGFDFSMSNRTCDKSLEIIEGENNQNIQNSFEKIPSTRSSLTLSLSNHKSIKQKKQQSSLLDAGFSRRRSTSPIIVQNRRNSKLNSRRNKDLDFTRGRQSPVPSQCNLDMSGSNQYITSSTPAIAPVRVKVKVEDRLLMVPVTASLLDSLDIDWLAKEAARRYYNFEGLEPVLRLLTPDGALLTPSDPLNLVVGIPELLSHVVSWNLPALPVRYEEACNHLKTNIDTHLHSCLDICQATQSLLLNDLSLSHIQLHPVFRSLKHQSNLQTLALSNNILTDEGAKLLCESLSTLKHLKVLDLSGNNLTHCSMEYFIELFNNKYCLTDLKELSLSFNPLGDESWRYLMYFLNKINLTNLCLSSCELSHMQDSIHLALKNIEILDISNNELEHSCFSKILSCIDSNQIKVLNLGSVGEKLTDMVKTLAAFFGKGTCENLTELNISRCNISDSDIVHLLRPLEKANKLKVLNLQYNNITSLSLCRLMEHKPSIKTIRLEGCSDIMKHLTSLQFDYIANIEEKPELIQLSINSSYKDNDYGEQFNILVDRWRHLWGEKAYVKRGSFGLVDLTVT